MTLADLRAYVRDLTGVYSTDLLSDALLDRWLQESYSELNRAEDWPWLTSIVSGTLAIGATSVTLANSSGRILEFAVTYPNSLVIQIPSRRGLIQTVEADDEHFYDCDNSGNIVLSKPFDEQVTYKVNYLLNAPLIQSVGTATSIPAEFAGILAYRAAAKVLRSQADDTGRDVFYLQEYASLLEDMRTSLTIDDDLGPIQIGGEILRVDGRTAGRVNLRFRSS